MLRSLLPTTLALLLTPALAFAAPADPAAVELSANQLSVGSDAPDHAERSTRRSKSGAKGDGKKEGDGQKSSGTAKKKSSSKGSGSTSRGSSGGSRSSGSSGSSRDRDDASSRERSEDRRSEGTRPSSPPPSRESDRDSSEGTRAREGGREASDGRGSRAAPYGGEGAGARAESSRPAAPGEARSGERTFSPSRSVQAPGPAATRKISAGMPASASGRAASPSSVRASASGPANFRGATDRMAVSGRGEASSRHGDADRGRDGSADRGRDGAADRGRDGAADRGRDGRDGAAERHGHGGSDAERATHGSHAGSERHREAVRHARSTASYHRSSASYHRAAASRHHAWSSARYARHGRWYHPGGWFRPYRPGHAYWYHGVFVYGPGPWHHDRVVVVERDGGGGGERNDEASVPERKVDRSRTFAVGIRGGSYMGGYNGGAGGFGDAGLGLAARYRPVESVGFELSWMHHDQTWEDGSERVYQPLQASVQLFGMPWTKVNPYVLAGVTVTGREVQDNVGFTTVSENSTLWGPHAGIGLELGLGKKASVNFDVRYTGYLNKPEGDITVPGAAQGNLGLNFYF